ncbi:unnamed protein product, partial [Coccothraustes coccothraustes]
MEPDPGPDPDPALDPDMDLGPDPVAGPGHDPGTGPVPVADPVTDPANDPDVEPLHRGGFRCRLCQITTANLPSLLSHLSGKRHRRLRCVRAERRAQAQRSLFVSGFARGTAPERLRRHFRAFGACRDSRDGQGEGRVRYLELRDPAGGSARWRSPGTSWGAAAAAGAAPGAAGPPPGPPRDPPGTPGTPGAAAGAGPGPRRGGAAAAAGGGAGAERGRAAPAGAAAEPAARGVHRVLPSLALFNTRFLRLCADADPPGAAPGLRPAPLGGAAAAGREPGRGRPPPHQLRADAAAGAVPAEPQPPRAALGAAPPPPRRAPGPCPGGGVGLQLPPGRGGAGAQRERAERR